MGPAVEEAIASLARAGIGLVDMKAMAGGPGNAVWPGQAKLPDVMKRRGIHAPALRWVLRNRQFASAMVGMISMEEVEENIGSAAQPFTPADQKLLAARLPEIRAVVCRMCGHCDARCPRGVPVADVLRCLMYAEAYGQFAEARAQFRRLPGPVQRVRCADCAACPVRCPNGVKVQARLARAQEWFA
jgi:predicted aldo/keto reductase-like oxidoreductase